MADLEFEWDPRKNRANQKKHHVSFDEAKTVFFDEGALVASDPEHSSHEERFIIIGFSIQLRLILVCYCERHDGNTVRIISARKASKKEQKQYNQGELL